MWASVACFKLAANAFERAGVCVYQSHRLERVVPTYVPAGVRSRGFVAAMSCPSGCGAVVHTHSLTQ